jgi:hypothetical protein
MNAWRDSMAGNASRIAVCGAIRVTLMALPLAALAVMSSTPGARATTKPASRQGSAAPAAPGSAGTGKTGGQASVQTGSAQAGADLPIPADEIIRRFAQHESDFKLARDNYTYTQEVLIQEGDGGEYQLVSEIVFTPQGKRYENITFAPPSTLRQISLSPEDMKDLENIQPFVLTTEDLPKYDVKFTGREKIDEVNTYVFQVAPKRMEKNQRYFQGTVWVDDHDLAVVKSDGKAVPDLKDNLFPRFITYRENIEGTFWFPTYTHADDELHFKNGDVHILMTVRYKNYKRFGSTIKLGPSKTVDAPPNPATPNPTAPPQR